MQKRLWKQTLAISCALAVAQYASAATPQHRVIVEVAPVDIGTRASDEMPAKVDLEWKRVLGDAKLSGKVDFDSIRVTQIDTDGKPITYGKGTDEKPTADRPFRWYDSDIPEMFPEFQVNLSRVADGKITPTPTKGVGHLYNTSGSGEKGALAFIHTQIKSAPARYAIDFVLLDANTPTAGNGPRGWIGDGQLRCDPLSTSTTGGGHTRISLDDWNGDGLIDIIQGEETGFLFVFLNTGTKKEPKYASRSFMLDAKGQPIDVGVHATPFAVDFDDDGVKDLLVGTYRNRLTYFKNTGTNKDRKLVYKGLVMIAGKPLELPIKPVAGGASEKIFNHDYYPNLDAVDWNGDGKMDLLAGGYVTGRVYFLENIGKNPDGTMKLRIGDPLEADGKPINVGDWCATPCVVNFNGDGALDLISGRQTFSKESAKDDAFLRYYQGGGTPQARTLTEKPFPAKGTFPGSGLGTPRAADLNDDGVPDLVVSSRQNIYIYYNRGTKTAPMIDAHAKPILLPWASAPLPAAMFVDFNRDGLVDLFGRYRIFINSGQVSPFAFTHEQNVLPPGVTIAHPSGIGDDWFWPALYDLDKDGDWDVLFGDWHGTVWFHRNKGTDAKPDYDLGGYRLQLTNGAEVKVGPIGQDTANNFAALQGARTEFAVDDIDGDGLPDLAIADTYGTVRYFKSVGPLADPKFEPAIEAGSLGTRCSVDTVDWDDDGKRDLVSGSSNGFVRIFRNIGQKGKAKFAEGIDPKILGLKQPRVRVVDLNHDGDEDFFVPSLQGSGWIERSYLKHGYAKAKFISLQSPDK